MLLETSSVTSFSSALAQKLYRFIQPQVDAAARLEMTYRGDKYTHVICSASLENKINERPNECI